MSHNKVYLVRDYKKNPETCPKCHLKGHSASMCWQDIRCEICDALGHPAERCFKKCNACTRVHTPGYCPNVEKVEQLAVWWKANPDKVKALGLNEDLYQHLNELARLR